jgi:hypothetical protein
LQTISGSLMISFLSSCATLYQPNRQLPGATVNYELLGVLSNGEAGMQVKLSVQLAVEKQRGPI